MENQTMSLGLAFWILMLIWLIFGLYFGYQSTAYSPYLIGGNLMLFVLLLLLGWQVFGPPLRGG
jgi:hypothetical protein